MNEGGVGLYAIMDRYVCSGHEWNVRVSGKVKSVRDRNMSCMYKEE
jgi:hypothetical protein